MEELNTQIILQLGMVGLLFFLAIREFFAYLKTKKNNNNSNGNKVNEQLLEAITAQNDNHLSSMQHSLDNMRKDINTGNDRIVSAITDMHTDLASGVGEVKGKLNNK